MVHLFRIFLLLCMIFFCISMTMGNVLAWSTTVPEAETPTITNPVSTAITDNSAILGASMGSEGTVSISEWGFVWSTTPFPRWTTNALGGCTSTIPYNPGFTCVARFLLPSTQYYFAAYAFWSDSLNEGTTYSTDGIFTTGSDIFPTPFFAAISAATNQYIANPPIILPEVKLVTEKAFYYGLTNGGLPTWYAAKNMWEYPATFVVEVVGCETTTVKNNGVRWETDKLVIKQSEFAERPMGIIATNCPGATVCKITYDSLAPPFK